MNKGPIDNCENLRGQIEKCHFSQENGAVLNHCSSPSSSRRKPIQQENTSPNLSWVTSPTRSTSCPISLAPKMHLQGVVTNSPAMVWLSVPLFLEHGRTCLIILRHEQRAFSSFIKARERPHTGDKKNEDIKIQREDRTQGDYRKTERTKREEQGMKTEREQREKRKGHDRNRGKKERSVRKKTKGGTEGYCPTSAPSSPD